ncbi:MAG: sugar phosphate isomerase/epimerase family protein [Armatimonadota bacterium]
MMTPAMWTSILIELPPVEAVRSLAGIGWEAFELSTEHLEMVADAASPEAAADELAAAVDDLGVTMPQAHLLISADVASLDEKRRESDLARVEQHIALCRRIGVEVGVIHPGGGQPATWEEWQRQAELRVDGFRRLAECAAGHDFRLAVEDTMDSGGGTSAAMGRRRYGAVIPELHELIDAVGADCMGICLDVGHANVQGLTMAEGVRQCGERLIALHIQDNDGNSDQHLAPGRGSIDWEAGIGALRELGFEGIFNLEIPGERGLPVELTLKRMEGVLAATRWLLER